MYFGFAQTRDWLLGVAELALNRASIRSGKVELFVIPSFLSLPTAIEILADTGARVGAQDLFWEDEGAYTGEVSGATLSEIGVALVEVGHAERRQFFREDNEIVALKATAALRNGLTPIICIGEDEPIAADEAGMHCVRQLLGALEFAPEGRVIVAYEPGWAVGAQRPASARHISIVCAELRLALRGLRGRNHSAVIYGGSAGPGLLNRLYGDVDGVFLGRFAHDLRALSAVLDEAERIL